jgi:NAD(P)-dependent dehydrogenase (short-subunit alcohol dehydrogenase family)
MKRAFITGCASGFGHALTRALLDEGYEVVASDVDVDVLMEAFDDLADHPNLKLLNIDVREEDQVRRGVSNIGKVDLLVNNAGFAVFGSQEETDLSIVKDLFEVNVFGPLRVTRALLPGLRARRGVIVQLSSVAGRTVFPESGFYAATKHALEALSEALFQETCTFGIRLRLVEPGSFATRFLYHAEQASPPRQPDSPYAKLRETWDARKWETLEQPQDPALVVRAIMDSLDDPRPWLRIPVGLDADRILGLKDNLSPDAWSRLAGARNGLEQNTVEPGDVLSPEHVLGLWAKRRKNAKWKKVELLQLAPTLAALRGQHLEHWRSSELGMAAMEKLSPLLED